MKIILIAYSNSSFLLHDYPGNMFIYSAVVGIGFFWGLALVILLHIFLYKPVRVCMYFCLVYIQEWPGQVVHCVYGQLS